MRKLYKKLFNTDEGQSVLHDLMKTHGVLRSVFSTDPIAMAYAEGQREVVLRIIHILNMVDDEVLEQHRKKVADEFTRYDTTGL